MSGGFAKVFESILLSSIWMEPDHVLRLFITFLVRCDRQGNVEGAVPGFARLANISIEKCEDAIARLEAPDPYSKTPDKEGRRIEKVSGGWHVINHKKYRDLMGVQATSSLPDTSESYVYYARDGNEVKIGLSKNPWSRINELRTGRPRLSLVAVERGGKNLEADRHGQFGHLALPGPDGGRQAREWFRWTDEIALFVATITTNVVSVATPTTSSATPSASATDSGVVVREEVQEEGVRDTHDYAIRLAVAANKGLDQPVPRILASSGSTHQVAEILRAADIPIGFAEQVVFDRASACKTPAEVRALSYFTRAVVEAWERVGLKDAAAASSLRGRAEPSRAEPIVQCPLCKESVGFRSWSSHFAGKHPYDDVPNFHPSARASSQ